MAFVRGDKRFVGPSGRVVACVAVAVALLTGALPASANATRTYMSCGTPPYVLYGEEYGGSISYRKHPRKCHYSPEGAGGVIILEAIRWRNWGKPRARAKAKRVDSHDMDRNGFQRHPVRLVLSRLRPAFIHEGRRKLYYTRLRLMDPSGSSGVISLFRPGQGPIYLPEYRVDGSVNWPAGS